MSSAQTSSLDLRLMRLGHTLLHEASVSRTAELLGQSQPAVSLALKRLREMTGDPLLVRSGTHLVPTDRGLRFMRTLGAVLAEIDRAFDEDGTFDPSRMDRPVRLVVANCFGALLMPKIVELIHAEAPDSSIDFMPMPQGGGELIESLADGQIDVVVGNWPRMPEALRFAPLLESEIVCMTRAGHPLAHLPSLTMETYMAASHLSPTLEKFASLSPIDGRLLELGIRRKIAVTVSEYNLVPHILESTDLLFTTSGAFAEQLASSRTFVTMKAPQELGTMQLYMLWHDRAHRSGSNRWLRKIIKRASRELAGTIVIAKETELAALA